MVSALAAATFAAPIGSVAQAPLPVEGTLPAFTGAVTWLNSEPLSAKTMRGKVVLVDFWTYTCINWQRTQPYVRAWAQRYKDEGLVVIGVHTPEFGFERNVDNIRPALAMFRVDYPVAVDSDSVIWNAFGNRYWPAVYIADANGNIRYHQFGEGEYERTEAVIRQLLREAGSPGKGNADIRIDARGSEVEADWSNLKSPETYLGRKQATGFAGTTTVGKTRTYAVPRTLALNQWGLAGDWTVNPGAIVLDRANGRIAFRFHARDVHLVMGPATLGSSVRYRVLLDGQPAGDAHGTDVDAQGGGVVSEQRLYQLVRQAQPIKDRLLEIEFLDPGVEAYVFTFG
jgi:thiol-disulfide isomerase/thioredoxin